ncbi:MAG: FIST C-terminal domain-containing protein [Lentisphaeria bacterium]
MYLPDASLDAIDRAVASQQVGPDEMMMILLADSGHPQLEALRERLNRRGVWFFGGVFPGLIADATVRERGALVTRLPAWMKPQVVRGLDQRPDAPPELMDGAPNGRELTALVFVDGITANIATFLADLFDRWGGAVHYLGAGAGSLSFKAAPCVFTQDGVFQDAAVVAVADTGSSIGVRHGWQRLAGPFVATKTSRNRIIELNWRNAFEVYREAIQDDSGQLLQKEDFLSVAKSYPLGLLKEGAENVVRDPVAVTDAGDLVCVGEVPEHAALDLLKGRPEWLVAAAAQAAADCQLPRDATPRQSLVMDCISRRLFLNEAIADEMAAIQRQMQQAAPGLPLKGALTIGEIASYGEGYLEFFNKTVVTGLLYTAPK